MVEYARLLGHLARAGLPLANLEWLGPYEKMGLPKQTLKLLCFVAILQTEARNWVACQGEKL